MQQKLPKISQTFARWLAVCALAAFAATTAVIYAVESYTARQDAYDLLRLNIKDVYQEIVDASDENLLTLTHAIAARLEPGSGAEQLEQLTLEFDVSEINVVDSRGIITATTNEAFLGYDMSAGSQSAEFLVLLEGSEVYVQRYQSVSYDSAISRKYAGVTLSWGGFVQVGYDTAHFQQDIRDQVVGVTHNRHVGEGGCIIICGEDQVIVSGRDGSEGKSLSDVGLPEKLDGIEAGTIFTSDAYGERCYCIYLTVEGYYAVSVLPVQEVTRNRNISVSLTLVMEAVIFAALFILLYVLLKKQVADNVRSINTSLARITGGDLEQRVEVGGSLEFSELSGGINTTVDTLKQYITDAEQRIDRELEFARTIQYAVMPSVFPPYPNRKDFAIYACVDTAKEVGGDFYDFYLLSENSLVFLVADVSGKGIPAAMFMMRAKTLLKSLAESGMKVGEVFTQANSKLCSGNEANMFVTAWMGVLDLSNGTLEYANAGHNPPLLRHGDGTVEVLRATPGLVLAGMEGITYRENRLVLQPDDMLYLYTDGVTEAADEREELFGLSRLVDAVSALPGSDPAAACGAVTERLNAFVGSAQQFDDITMLGVSYAGPTAQRELNITAVPENLETVNAFVEAQLERWDCPPKTQMQLLLAVEEIFVNISSYAYDPAVGPATIRVEVSESPMEVVITFMDRGKPYDPLQRRDPDIALPAEARDPGGLGIFLVKQTMDDIRYEYSGGKNILRIVKRW